MCEEKEMAACEAGIRIQGYVQSVRLFFFLPDV